MSIRELTEQQYVQTKLKITDNIHRMLRFLEKCLGTPDSINPNIGKEFVFEMYVIFSHAVEEYGKRLYLDSLNSDNNGKYHVDYSRNGLLGHEVKLDLANNDLPDVIKVLYPAQFDKSNFSSDFASDEITVSRERRENVLHVGLDEKNNPTNITFDVDIDLLRKAVFEFRNYSNTWKL